ncbi:hypothetical protein BD410DRAFT_766657 [Rickenella mellea]|uniref:Uncharacterized protein n=1 Tax=Rickenella mellea TaxID=50990 RepID=A0A4Y7QBE7_9AGAM|nr:hypothetical protein BD410DRAFT_766657 [Rickenella mellea]
MSTVTPTLIPRAPYFPSLLPEAPKPHPTPLPPKYSRPPSRLNAHRNILVEQDDLSDEEQEVEEIWRSSVRHRGFNYLHIIGRLYTQQEEKNDQADTDSDDSGSNHSGAPASNAEDGENDSQHDLDANMEDLDEEPGDITVETEDPDDAGEEIDDYDDDQDL